MTGGGKGPTDRDAPLEMRPEEFRSLGHGLVDRIADFLASLRERPVAGGQPPAEIRKRLDGGGLPERGSPPGPLLEEAGRLLFENSVLPGHPRFLGYVIGAGAPIGALADLLASSVNQNVGAWHLAPMATEMEAQTVRWIAEMLGLPPGTGGLLTSGGNMANFVGFLAARRARVTWDARTGGMGAAGAPALRLYATEETHTWIDKAVDLFGLGTGALRAVATDRELRMDTGDLERLIREDREAGRLPFLVVASGGTVSTGAVDPLPRIAAIARREGLWLHVDGAYGGFAAGVPGAPEDLAGLAQADSVAVDPHKWLYAPLEAGCALVRDPAILRSTFEHRPPYYRKDEDEDLIDYHSYGPQNSRGLRALKVWLGLRMAGREGYRAMIAGDIALAQRLYEAVGRHPELEAGSVSLSVTTFRYVPPDLESSPSRDEAYLDRLNAALLERLQADGDVYLSNAVVHGRYLLRSCIVNFRTTEADADAVPEIVARAGREIDRRMRAGTA
ncbi:MAG: pyridoxal phosphate-dependent decarboxylase family protein [Syntrophomonadaceae bacterium]